MDVNVAGLGIGFSAGVSARLEAAQPQDPGEYPIALRVFGTDRVGEDISSRFAPDEYRINSAILSYLLTDFMPPTRRALAVQAFTGPVPGRRYRIARYQSAVFQHAQLLAGKINFESFIGRQRDLPLK